MDKKLLLATAIGSVVIGAGLMVAVSASAHRGFSGDKSAITAEKKELHQELKTTVEDGDYQAWKTLVESKPKITDIIDSEEKFQKLAEMHKLKKAGDIEAAKELAEELGLFKEGKHRFRHHK